MKQTMKYLSIAALVAVGAIMMGCNKLDIVTEQTQQEEEPVISNTVTLTTTVSLDASTKALTAAGVKTFAADDQIAVIYKNTSNETVKAVSEVIGTEAGTASATFTVTLTNPDKTKAIRYIYPAAMAKATVATDATIDDDGTVDFTNLNTQNGLLTTLGSNLDLSTFDAASWGGDVLPNGTLSNQLAILALTLKNSTGSSDITSTITGVTLSDGTNSYAVTRSAAAGPIYVAIQPTTSAAISVTATDGTNNYTKSLTGKTYAASNGYSVSWRMAQSLTPAGVEAVDLGLSVKWANMNVGAESVTDYGKYYAWGATTDNLSESKDYQWSNTPYYTGDGSTHSWSKYTGSDSKSTLEAADDAAAVNWGGSWRMPTDKEMEELLDNTTRTWQSNYNSSGIAGYLFTSTKTGYTDKSIFLPAAGYRDGSSLSDAAEDNGFWSSTHSSNASCGRSLIFVSGYANMYSFRSRYYGLPVRAVQDK